MLNRFLFNTITILTITIAALAGCGNSDFPLLYTLEHEQDVPDGNLNNSLVVGSMTQVDDKYYIAAMDVYVTSSLNDDWRSTSGQPTGMHCTTLADINSTVYAIFYNYTSNASRLYSYTNTGWKAVNTSGIDSDYNIYGQLASANNTLFMSTYSRIDNASRLYRTTDGTNFTQVGSIVMSRTQGNLDVAYGGGEYLITFGTGIYRGTSGIPVNLSGGQIIDKPTGVYYSTTSYNNKNWFVAARTSSGSAKIFSWDGSGDLILETSPPVDPTDFAEFNGALLLGTKNGYREGSSSGNSLNFGTPALTADTIEYRVSELSVSHFVGFFVDSENKELYGLTFNGLWVNRAGTRTWYLE